MAVKIAVFISGSGSNLQSLIDHQEAYRVSLVISDKKEAKGLERGENQGIPSIYVGKDNYPDKQERCQEVLQLLKEHQIEYIALAGYLSIVPQEIIQEFPNKIINIHPSLIPSFCGKGFHGEHVHQAVYDNGVKITGATVHFVDQTVDGGAIIAQEAVAVGPQDSPEIIGRKVLKVEHQLFPQVMNQLAMGAIEIQGKRTFRKENL